jgi:hypothetical protein
MERELGGIPLNGSTLFEIASVTKTFTSQVHYSQIGDYDLALRDRLQIPSLNRHSGSNGTENSLKKSEKLLDRFGRGFLRYSPACLPATHFEE